MNYQLSFLDDAGRIREIREANFETEHEAMCWMWIASGVRALDDDWSVVELRSKERCAARVPAKSLKHASNGRHRTKHRVMIVDSDGFADIDYEGLVRTAGYSVAEYFFDNVSAEKWLSTHSPDAAVIEVRLGDQSCIALAQKLAERGIPFLVVSNHSADLPAVDRIFQSVPWFEKPVTSTGLRLALSCML
jgi:two-component system, response regulator PdtaR